ncbi:MAG: ubiquinol-cytochrome c reductase iron-sulfur subunit [Myxococcaceae bacterium]
MEGNCKALSRRDVLVVGGAAALFGLEGCALLKGGATHPTLNPSSARLEGGVLRIPLSELSAIPSGDVLEVKSANEYPDLLITQGEVAGTYRVITAKCTHRGCIVDWKAEKQEWECACHGSRFAPQGAVLEGPADAPLKAPQATVEGDQLAIQLGGLKA